MYDFIIPKTKKSSRDNIIVIEKGDTIAVKVGNKVYPLHPLMFLICDRSVVYASKLNDYYPKYYEITREIKPIKNEKTAINFWLPYKPGLKLKGEIINGKYYDFKRASALKTISEIYTLFNRE